MNLSANINRISKEEGMVYACKGGVKKILCTQLSIILATLINVSYDQIRTKFPNLE